MDRREEARIDREIHRAENGTDPFSAAVRATRMPMLITDPRQDDNPIVFVNDAFRRLTGYTREETLGRNCRFLQGPGTNREDVAKIRDAIARRVPIEIELLNYKKDGTTFWNRLLLSPVFDGEDLTFFFASQFDVTLEKERLSELSKDRSALEAEIKKRTADLTASEERLRFTLTAGRLGAWTLDLDTKRLVASAICKETYGRGPADTFSYEDLQAAIHPDDLERWRAAVDRSIAEGGELEIEYRAVLPNGAVRWILVRGQTTTRADGTPLGMAGVTLDVTERKQAEEHRNLLTRELDHRVKNTLAAVQSIVLQSLRTASSIEDAQEVVVARIAALAGAHDLLVGEGWSGASLSDVFEAALRPFRNEREDRIHCGGPDVMLRPQAATALALAIHELATNAVKYGALSGETGRVIVNWEALDHGSDRFQLVWQELDGPPVKEPERRGFGSRMIQQALPAELGGEGRLEYRPQGIRFTLDADLSSVVE